MARQPEPVARRNRVVALGALALLAFATAWAFGRVFRGHGPTYRLIAVAFASILVAAAFERRSLLLATVASAALLSVAIGLLVFPHTTLFGLPTRETLVAIGRAVDKVGHQARVKVAPADPLAPLMLAAVTAVWAAMFSAHALAVRAGSPLLAVLPPVALVGFTDTAMQDGPRFGYGLMFLMAVLAVVFGDGIRRIMQWGPLWPVPGSSGRTTMTSTRGARKVALAAMAVAALVPGILPGLRAGPLINFSGGHDTSIANIDPLVSLASRLRSDATVVYFRVDATPRRPSYYRLFALDTTSDGVRWTASTDPELRHAPLVGSPARVGPPAIAEDQLFTQTMTLQRNFGNRSLPAAYQPVEISLGSGGPVRYDADTSVVASEDPLSAGDSYTVKSLLVEPTAEQLRGVSFATPARYGTYTSYPADIPQGIKDLAEKKAGPESLPAFDRILRIQNWLKDTGGFTYSEDVEYPADIGAVRQFLDAKKGFCQQFATTMALMLRTLGYPARLAVGYTSGTENSEVPGSYIITNRNLHTWVEVDFPGYGWIAFEPTPQRTNPVAEAAYLNPAGPLGRCEGGACSQQPKPAKRTGKDAASLESFRGQAHLGRRGGPRSSTELFPTPTTVPWSLIFRVLFAAAGILLLLVPLGKFAWRLARLIRERDPTKMVLATYRVFTGEAADLGLGRNEGETVDEYERRLAGAVSFSDGHLETLSGLVDRAAYSGRPVSEADARSAGYAARTAMREMRRNTALVRRIVGIYRPGI